FGNPMPLTNAARWDVAWLILRDATDAINRHAATIAAPERTRPTGRTSTPSDTREPAGPRTPTNPAEPPERTETVSWPPLKGRPEDRPKATTTDGGPTDAKAALGARINARAEQLMHPSEPAADAPERARAANR
ncbi:hypothetical protein Uis1B_2256, partial [Bifidobacterium margollesii]